MPESERAATLGAAHTHVCHLTPDFFQRVTKGVHPTAISKLVLTFPRRKIKVFLSLIDNAVCPSVNLGVEIGKLGLFCKSYSLGFE